MSKPKYSAEEFGEKVLDLLKAQTENTEAIVYADLGGRVLDGRSFADELDADQDFALQQVDMAIQARPDKELPLAGEISPREQRRLAEVVLKFGEKHPKVAVEDLFVACLRARPLLAAGLTPIDVDRVAKTLRIEHGVAVTVPSPEDLSVLQSRFDEE